MRKAVTLVQRLTDAVVAAATAAVHGAEELLGSLAPRPQEQLVPVRVRDQRRHRRD